MALGETRCEERSDFWSLFILEALEPPEREKLAQPLAVTPGQRHAE